jgi:hypothetical protein
MNVEIGTETPIFLSGNICFEISVFCLCSVVSLVVIKKSISNLARVHFFMGVLGATVQ